MSIFPQNTIDKVLSALESEEILRRIGYRTEMIQDTGQAIKCFCPIHKETIFRTLLVDKESGEYRCSNYNCPGRTGGDLIDLYARSKEISYEQALLELAATFSVEVDLTDADQYLETTLEVANNYLELGVLTEAEEQYERILGFKKDFVPALEGLMAVHQKADRPEEARRVQLDLARTLIEREEYERGLEVFKEYIEAVPENLDVRLEYIGNIAKAGKHDWAAGEYVNLADDLVSRGEIDRALDVYRSAQALNVEEVDVSIHIIQLLSSAGRTDEAVAECLAKCQQRLDVGDPEGAVAALEAALDLALERDDLRVRLCEIVAEHRLTGSVLNRAIEHVVKMIAAREHGPAAQALDALEMTFADRPRLMELRADLEESRGNEESALEMRLQCIDRYYQRREFDAALGVLEKTMAVRTENVALLSRKANLLREMGRPGPAIEVYKQIIELFRNADEYEHAAAVYQTIIDLEPEKIVHRERQLELYFQLGMEPVIAQKALELADLLRGQDKLSDASLVLTRALEKAPQSVELLQLSADLYEQQGRRGEAAEQFLELGRLLSEHGDVDAARKALDRALKCVPEHLEAREALADVLVEQEHSLQAMGIYNDLTEFFLRENQVDACIRNAKKILKIQPEHLPTLLVLAKAYHESGQIEQQRSIQTRLVQLYLQGQSYTRATELCEEILNEDQDFTPALEQLVKIAESTRQPTQSVKYLWKLAQVHARAGRREPEEGILKQVLEKEPLHEAAWRRYLELQAIVGTPRSLSETVERFIREFDKANRLDDAAAVLEELKRTHESKAEIFGGLARLYKRLENREAQVEALRTQAELLGRHLRDEEALEVWDKLAGLMPEDVTILRTRIEIMRRNNMTQDVAEEYRRLSNLLLKKERYEEAEVALLEVLGLRPTDQEARDDLIGLLIKTGEHERAAEQIEEAASHLIERGHPEDAIKVYERIFEFDPQRESTHRRIIALHQRLGRNEAALAAYERLLDQLHERGAGHEFEQAAKEAIKLEPENTRIRQRLADFYLQQGRGMDAESSLLTLAVEQIESADLDAAEKTIDRLLEINPASVPARAHRADILARRGKTSEALSEFMHLTGDLARAGSFVAAQSSRPGEGDYEGMSLVPDYTFESFVVGDRNNFAHATCMAVSRAPGKNYNPLFLYSDVGLGKTHLCHAVCHYVRDHHPQMRVLYKTTETFVAELIDAISSNQISAFRNRHKTADVLIMDDVQFLSGKERAQEEFFHVFNTLFQAGKQVVVTSDRPPKDISHLEKRLKSRFGAGIIVDIQSPDLETRVAILRHELVQRGCEDALSDEVMLFIAENVQSNVRELKGALTQILARQEFSGEPMDIVAARQILDQSLTNA